MERFNIKIGIVFLLTMISFCNCSKSELGNNEQEEEMVGNRSGITLVDQINLGGENDEFGIDIIATSNGFIICGVANGDRPYLIAIDSNFNVLWEKTLGVTGVGGFEKIIQTNDGNYVAAGFTEFSGNNDLDLDIYAVKVNSFGEILWENTFNFNYVTDTTVDLIETSNGDLIIAGSKLTEPIPSNILNIRQDILVSRIDSNGNLIWSNTYGGIESDEGLSSIIEENNGNLLIGGSMVIEIPNNNGSIATIKRSNVLVLRINADGELLDEKTFGSSENDGAARLHKLSNGQIVVVSSSSGSDGDVSNLNKGESDVWIFTLNNNLTINTQVSIGGAGRDNAIQLIEKDNNEYFLVGDTNSHLVSSSDLFSSPDYWILKLSSSFAIIDETTLGGSDFDSASGAILQDGKLVVVGSTNSTDGDVANNKGAWDIWVTFIEDID